MSQPFFVLSYLGLSTPTVQPFSHSCLAIPAPPPVAVLSSVNIAITSAAVPSVFLPFALVVTLSNFTRVAFKDPSPTNATPSSCSTSKPVAQLLNTTFSNAAFVPTRSFNACGSPPSPLPISVRFLIVGLETGVAVWLLLLLSASIPRLPSFVRTPYQFSPVPTQPSVQSNKSSPTN